MNESLKQAIIEQLGYESIEDAKDTLSDVASYGASAGYGQFIYHSDTCKFFQDNKSDIVELAEEQSEQFGQGILEMIAGFNSLIGNYSESEIGRVIFGDDEDTQIENTMAWFALEALAYESDS